MRIVRRTGKTTAKIAGAPFVLNPGDVTYVVVNPPGSKPEAERLIWRARGWRKWRARLRG